MAKEDQEKERKDAFSFPKLASEKRERDTLERYGEQSHSQEGVEPKPNLSEDRQTRGELAILSLERRHEILQETLDTDPFATHIDLPALSGWHPATDPDLDGANDTPPLLLNEEEYLSLYGNPSLGGEQRSKRNTRFDTRDVIRALLPHDLAEEIVSSSSLSNPPPPLLRNSSTSIRSLGSGAKDGLVYPEPPPALAPAPVLPPEEQHKPIKVASSKARDLLHHCFFEEKGQGVVYAALVEMESRRCLASLCLDDGEEGTSQEAAVEENAMVLWVLFRTMKSADVRGNLEEVLISLEQQYHIFVPLSAHATVFLYVAFRKDWGTPPLMRLYFRRLREELEHLLGGEKVI